MKKLKVLFTVLCVACATTVWGENIYSETFGDNGNSNTAFSSASCYSATTSMFTDPSQSVASHYSGNGKVGKNSVNPSSGYTNASGKSAAWYQGGSGSGTTTILQIAGINIQNYTNLSLSFGGYLTNGALTTNKIEVYIKIDDGTETKLTYSGLSKVATWSLCTGTISETGNSLTLIFKQVRSGGFTVRVDDILLSGTKSSGSGETTNYTVQWMVGGAEYTKGNPTTEVASGSKVTTLPTAPADNRLSCAEKFMGWSTTNIGATPQSDAPEILFTTAENSPNITANTTFYAVFATKQTN